MASGFAPNLQPLWNIFGGEERAFFHVLLLGEVSRLDRVEFSPRHGLTPSSFALFLSFFLSFSLFLLLPQPGKIVFDTDPLLRSYLNNEDVSYDTNQRDREVDVRFGESDVGQAVRFAEAWKELRKREGSRAGPVPHRVGEETVMKVDQFMKEDHVRLYRNAMEFLGTGDDAVRSRRKFWNNVGKERPVSCCCFCAPPLLRYPVIPPTLPCSACSRRPLLPPLLTCFASLAGG